MLNDSGGETAKPRLLLVDDHHLMLEGLRLELANEYEIVGTLASGRQVVAECQRLQPDAVVLDLSLPERSGLEVIIDLRATPSPIKILVVTMHRDRVLANATIEAGANGFVPKDAQFSELHHAIREILAGRTYLSRLIDAHAHQRTSAEVGFGLGSLTPRQREVVHLLGDGKSTARIATELHVSKNTVTFHRVRIRKALGLASEWGLLRYAMAVKMDEERTQD